MCIIVVKKKGIDLPSKETLKTCFERNHDGAGLMYVQNGQVIIDKGYMDFKSFYKRLQKVEHKIGNLKNHAIVMHFRIGTQGANDKATTHPFPISNKVEDLKATYFRTDVGMVHNGIISKFNYDKTISDTQLFIKDFVSVIKKLRVDFYKDKDVLGLLKNEIGYSKLCFLDKDENIYYIGDKVEDNGIIYSNDTYKPYEYKYNTRTKYSSAWDYDWNDYDYEWDYSYYKKKVEEKETKQKEVKDFIQNQIKYEILNEGDCYMCGELVDQVYKDETIVVDNQYNLYELIGDVLSLIGTKATIFDSEWKLKTLTFKGGDIL